MDRVRGDSVERLKGSGEEPLFWSRRSQRTFAIEAGLRFDHGVSWSAEDQFAALRGERLAVARLDQEAVVDVWLVDLDVSEEERDGVVWQP